MNEPLHEQWQAVSEELSEATQELNTASKRYAAAIQARLAVSQALRAAGYPITPAELGIKTEDRLQFDGNPD
ncbi:MAG TPA: hypothetical protein VFL85_01680 [Candidatus Saccharimonadales bacterium]|nr:hypothetical protein [Candidatus Saccharimonadales bacterium]